jgi:hypothetical protein
MRVNYWKTIFLDGVEEKDAGDCANKFVDEFIAIQIKPEQIPTGVPKEKLLAQLFNTITKLQNIIS